MFDKLVYSCLEDYKELHKLITAVYVYLDGRGQFTEFCSLTSASILSFSQNWIINKLETSEAQKRT